MTVDVEHLPDDVSALKAIVRQQAAEREQLAAKHDQLGVAIADRDAVIKRLEHRIAQLQRALFGRRSEKIDPDQLMLFAQELMEQAGRQVKDERAGEEEEPDRPAKKSRRRKNGARIPEHLERRREEITLAAEERICDECGCCCDHVIGEEVTELLECIPMQMWVRQIVRPKYACRACEGRIKIASLPPRAIEKGIAGTSLLAKIVTDKYCDHQPLYRQEGIFARYGLHVPRSTLCAWIMQVAGLLEPIWDYLFKEVPLSAVLHTDDTVVPVQRPGSGSTAKARLWSYVGDRDHPHVAYDYTSSRSRDGPMAFLAEYEGYLQADAYAGYDELYQSGRVVEVGCWSHVRRKFYDARESDVLLACTAMAYIQRLYAVEDEARKLDDDARRGLRQERAVPILADLRAWLDEVSGEVLPRSPLAGAITYAVNQWDALTRYVEDGRLNIDNNAAERSLKPVVLGRKNWLFAGSDEGGRRAAILFSIVESCRRNDVNVYDYLCDVLERASTHPAKRIAELAPAEWQKRFAQATAETA